MSTAPRIAWGITGAGHFLKPCVELLVSHSRADVFFSAAGLEVVKRVCACLKTRSSWRKLYLRGQSQIHSCNRQLPRKEIQ